MSIALDPEQSAASRRAAGGGDSETHCNVTFHGGAEIRHQMRKADFFAGTDEAVNEVVDQAVLLAGPESSSIERFDTGAEDRSLAGPTNNVGYEPNRGGEGLA